MLIICCNYLGYSTLPTVQITGYIQCQLCSIGASEFSSQLDWFSSPSFFTLQERNCTLLFGVTSATNYVFEYRNFILVFLLWQVVLKMKPELVRNQRTRNLPKRFRLQRKSRENRFDISPIIPAFIFRCCCFLSSIFNYLPVV